MLLKYTNKELDLCARLMRAEALGEGELAMLMVGNVIVNRAISNCLDFKNIRSIKDVIYQRPGGFVGTNSSLFNSGSSTTKEKELAKRVLKGETYYPATNALWFMLQRKMKNVKVLGLNKEIQVDIKVIVSMNQMKEYVKNYIKKNSLNYFSILLLPVL